MQSLGRLEPVDVREYWKNEATDFTPWLAQEENIRLLSQLLGIELELEGIEENVGPFRADIVCRDTLNDQRILVENQLEQTDHRHLGQLMTYAAGLTAVTIVWVASSFREEHRAALDWLNEITGEDINFFGLEIELWRIGESAMAPKFNIVSKPNNWTKAVVASRSSGSGEMTQTKQMYLQYWTQFKAFVEKNASISKISSGNPPAKHRYNFSIGHSGFRIRAVTGIRDCFLELRLQMSDKNSKAYFHLLYQDKSEIESEIGSPLQWRELPNNVRSEISLRRDDVNPQNPDKWGDYHRWLLTYIEKFYTVFVPRIDNLDVADYIPDDEDFDEE